MIDITQELINYKGDSIRIFLIQVGVMPEFEKLQDEDWIDNPTFESLVKYIVSVYSVNSPFVIIGTNWLKFKKQMFEKYALPSDFFDEIVMLKNINVAVSIKKWLDFQNQETNAQLCMLKDLRTEMQISAVSIIKKANMEIDYDQKFKNAEYSNKLLLMIRETEQSLIQNDPKMKEGHQEVKKATNNQIFASPELYSK